MLPPVQLLEPLRVSAPVPLRVPPVKEKGPLTVEVPERSKLPEAMVSPSADSTRAATAVPLTVTTGLPSGPRSMITVSPALGTALPLQLLAVFQKPLESVFQTLTPVYTVPRCSTALLASPPAT